MLKKADVALVILLIAVCAVWILTGLPESGTRIAVTVDGEEYIQADLTEDQVIELPNAAIQIENGEVRFLYSDCPNQVCVHQGAVHAGSLICLPNRIVVEVLTDDYDVIVGR